MSDESDNEDIRVATDRAVAALSAAVDKVDKNEGAMVIVYLSPAVQFGVASWLAGDTPPPPDLIAAMLEAAAAMVKDSRREMATVDGMRVQRPKGGV